MKQLLRFEFRKLFRRKSFYICLAVQVGYLILTALLQLLLYKVIFAELGEENIEAAVQEGMVVTLTGVQFLLNSLEQGATLIVLAVFVSLFACEDRTSDSLKNVYSRGYGATEVYFAELIAVCVYGVIFCAVSWLTGFLAGTATFGVGSGFTGRSVFMLFSQIVVVIAITGLFFMFSKIIPRQGGVIAMNIFAPMIISLVFSLVDAGISLARRGATDVFMLSKYSPSGLLSTLSSGVPTYGDIAIALALGVVYAAVFIAIGALANRKRPA